MRFGSDAATRRSREICPLHAGSTRARKPYHIAPSINTAGCEGQAVKAVAPKALWTATAKLSLLPSVLAPEGAVDCDREAVAFAFRSCAGRRRGLRPQSCRLCLPFLRRKALWTATAKLSLLPSVLAAKSTLRDPDNKSLKAGGDWVAWREVRLIVTTNRLDYVPGKKS
jgi:hypothetical protein